MDCYLYDWFCPGGQIGQVTGRHITGVVFCVVMVDEVGSARPGKQSHLLCFSTLNLLNKIIDYRAVTHKICLIFRPLVFVYFFVFDFKNFRSFVFVFGFPSCVCYICYVSRYSTYKISVVMGTRHTSCINRSSPSVFSRVPVVLSLVLCTVFC